MQFDAGDAVAEIDERSAGVGADDSVGAAKIGDAGVAGNGGNWNGLAGRRLEAVRLRRASTKLVREAASSFSTGAPTGSPRAFMRATVSATPAASHISKGPSSQLKPARMAASMEGASSATSPMRSAAKFQSDGEKRPEKGGGFVFCGVVREQQAQALGQSGGVLRHFKRGQRGLGGRAVFEGGEIEDEALIFAVIGTADFLVEALPGFVAEPAALEQFVENRGELAASDALREVGGNVGEDVDADEIGEAKCSGARPADGGTGERVDFFDSKPCSSIRFGGVEHDRDADAIGDEVGRVVREDDLLAEHAIGEGGEGGDDGGIGVGSGNDFEEAHVARRIEEVRAEEAVSDRRECGGDLRDGQAGGVGGEKRVRSEVRKDAGKQRGFDFEIFGDGFDDPVALGEFGQIVVEGAGGDERGERRLKKGGGLGFGEGGEVAPRVPACERV